MADFVFNIAKGAIAEMARNGPSGFLMLLLKTAEADATMKDYDTVADLLAGTPDEADATNYVRKTGITATITVDDTNDRVDVDMPDQTWTSLGNPSNNTITDLIVAHDQTSSPASDAQRIPCTCHDLAFTTFGSDVTAQLNAAGFFRAS